MDVLSFNVEIYSYVFSRFFSEKICYELVFLSKFCCKVIGYYVFKDVLQLFVVYIILVIDFLDRIWKV